MSAAPERRVAVVTGGARRLGRHLCLSLATRGYDVVIVYRSSDDDARALEREIAARGGRARALKVDVADKQAVAAAFAGIGAAEGRVDLLVNNVGNYNPQPVTALDPAEFPAANAPIIAAVQALAATRAR